MSLILGCSCASGHGNTATPNCIPVLGKALGYGVTSVIGNAGVLNSISLVGPAPITTFTTNLTNANVNSRIYPVTQLRNVTWPKEETQFATDGGGVKAFVRDGIRSFLAEKWNVSQVYEAKLKQGRCNRNAVYVFTKEGLVGLKRGATLYPIEINAYDANWMQAVDDAPDKVVIGFDYDPSVNVGELWRVPWSVLGTTYQAVTGLIDANILIKNQSVGATNTATDFAVYTDYEEGLFGQSTVDGLVAANFTLTNVTTGLAVTIISVTEVADTKYTVTYVNQTAADVLKLSIVTTTGYEGFVTFVAQS